MNPATWLLLKSMLADALERPRVDRLAFIERACQERPRLYWDACSLLSEEHDDDFLEPAAMAAAEEQSSSVDGWLGCRIGALRVERLIARGGTANVFFGMPDDGPGAAAAIKIPSAASASTSARRSLEHEHDMMSCLDHPLIVQSLGTDSSGRSPCLVMEYVDGLPIDRYCARHELGVAARVALVRLACEAVAHAHERGVVHADLKPANLLITPTGKPRLVDFGIARRLDADWPGAALGLADDAAAYAAFTPECAAPEQLRNQRISQATDVYAMGVMLHRLLTGHLPHQQLEPLNAWQRLRAVCHDDPLPPSQCVRRGMAAPAPGLPPAPELARQLSGKLDRIIGRALARDPYRRHASIKSFANDLSGALDDLGNSALPAQTDTLAVCH